MEKHEDKKNSKEKLALHNLACSAIDGKINQQNTKQYEYDQRINRPFLSRAAMDGNRFTVTDSADCSTAVSISSVSVTDSLNTLLQFFRRAAG